MFLRDIQAKSGMVGNYAIAKPVGKSSSFTMVSTISYS